MFLIRWHSLSLEEGMAFAKKTVEKKLSLKELSKKHKAIFDPERLPSGSVVLDAVLGGGMPRGSYIEIASAPGCGKTTALLYVCYVLVLNGYMVAYLDHEQAITDSQLAGIGLLSHLHDYDTNPEGLFRLYQPESINDAEDFMDELLPLKPALIVIDSITAMYPKSVKDKKVEDIRPGLQSQATQSFLIKYKGECRRAGTIVFFINQMRTKIRMRGTTTEEAAGGFGLKHYMDIRLMMDGIQKMKRKEKTINNKLEEIPYGARMNIYATKSKWSRPYVKVPLYVIFAKGISNINSYADFLIAEGVVTVKGAFYTLHLNEEEIKCHGQAQLAAAISQRIGDIEEFVKTRGGFSLIREPSTDEMATSYDDGFDDIDDSED
jgi:recombination protein RecA